MSDTLRPFGRRVFTAPAFTAGVSGQRRSSIDTPRLSCETTRNIQPASVRCIRLSSDGFRIRTPTHITVTRIDAYHRTPPFAKARNHGYPIHAPLGWGVGKVDDMKQTKPTPWRKAGTGLTAIILTAGMIMPAAMAEQNALDEPTPGSSETTDATAQARERLAAAIASARAEQQRHLDYPDTVDTHAFTAALAAATTVNANADADADEMNKATAHLTDAMRPLLGASEQ